MNLWIKLWKVRCHAVITERVSGRTRVSECKPHAYALLLEESH